MSVRYSPLCDTDLGAYLAYCAGVVAKGSKVKELALLEKFQQLAVTAQDGRGRVLADSCSGGGSAGRSGRCGACGFGVGCMAGAQSPRLLCDVGSDRFAGGGGSVGCGVIPGASGDRVQCVSGYNVVGGVVGGDDASVVGVGSGGANFVECSDQVSLESGSASGLSAAVSASVERPDGCDGSESGVSERTLRNRQLRQEKKRRKQNRQAVGQDWRLRGISWRAGSSSSERVEVGLGYKGAFQSCSEEVRRRLAETRAARLIAENELKAAESLRKLKRESDQQEVVTDLRKAEMELRVARARQQRELLEAQDVEKLKKMHATRVMRQTETNKVAVEKAFCSLAGSGNVPSLVGGHASTVKSGSISPNSSVSEAEVRALQKGFADLKASNESLENRMRHLKLCAERDDFIGMKATMATFEPEGCEESVGLTIPEGGVPSIWYGEGAGGYVGKDGRFHSEPEETFGYESLSF